MWIGLALSYFLTSRASELFVGKMGGCLRVYCLLRRDEAFFRENKQLREGKRQEANKVEVRFGRSKGDQWRKGAVLVRTRTGGEGKKKGGQ